MSETDKSFDDTMAALRAEFEAKIAHLTEDQKKIVRQYKDDLKNALQAKVAAHLTGPATPDTLIEAMSKAAKEGESK